MSLLDRLLFLGCLVALLLPFGQAQIPSEAVASAANSSPGGWVGREDPKAAAWRAYDAMLTHDESAIPELLSLASEWRPLFPQTLSDDGRWRHLSSEQEEERDAMTVVLDALIQLKAPVPGTALRTLSADFETAAAIILARIPVAESGSLSLDLYRSPPKESSTLQYVAAALLALHPRSGFAATLLGDIRVQAKVFAIIPGGAGIGYGVGGSCMQPSEPERDDWPKIGQYRLSIEPSEGASILVGGAEPIYVTRVESTHYLRNSCGTAGLYLGREQRRAFIAEMLGILPQDISWRTDVATNIEFTSLGQFTDAVLAFIEEQQRMYRATAKELEAHGLLDLSEVQQSLPRIELDLTDARCVGSDDEDSDDDKDTHEKCEHEIEPISQDAIKLPARVAWAQ